MALKKIVQENISINKIAMCFKRGPNVIRKIIEDNNLTLHRNNHIAMDKDTLIKCAKIAFESFNIKSDRNTLNSSEIDNLQNLIKEMPFEQMCISLNKNYKAVKQIFLVLDLNSLLSCDAILDYKYSEEFNDDLSNPEKTNTVLSRKYGMSNESLRKWRYEHYGNMKIINNNFLNKSSAEVNFEEILYNIDLSFFYQKIIEGYKCDYYLGQKVIVEVQGDYWHSKTSRKNVDIIKQDNIKKNILEKAGYTVLQISEYDINNNVEKVASTVIEAYFNKILNKQ